MTLGTGPHSSKCFWNTFIIVTMKHTTNSQLFWCDLRYVWSCSISLSLSPDQGSQDEFLANVNSRSRFAVARPSVVCNVRATFSGGSNSRQYFYGITPSPSTESFTFAISSPDEFLLNFWSRGKGLAPHETKTKTWFNRKAVLCSVQLCKAGYSTDACVLIAQRLMLINLYLRELNECSQ